MKLMPRIASSFRLIRPGPTGGRRGQAAGVNSEILCSVSVTELRTEVPVAGPRCAAWARSRKSIKLVLRSEFTGMGA